MTDQDARCWAYGPEGEAQLFDTAKDVPAGWADTPAEFGRVETPDPLDHDGDGKKGGSKKKPVEEPKAE